MLYSGESGPLLTIRLKLVYMPTAFKTKLLSIHQILSLNNCIENMIRMKYSIYFESKVNTVYPVHWQ